MKSLKVRLAIVGAVVLACALLAAVLANSGDDDVAFENPKSIVTGVEFGTVTVTGDVLPDFATEFIDNPQADPANGLLAPTMVGQRFDQSSIAIAPSDKFKLVLFLAHWCPHCNAEIPLIVESMSKNEFDSRVEVVAVATAIDETLPNFPPSEWFANNKYTGEVFLDDRNALAMNSFGGASFPFFVLLSEDNTVLWRGAGELPPGTLVTQVNSRVAASASPAE
jgi:thiol-disulfide isomerase/thioredoxin